MQKLLNTPHFALYSLWLRMFSTVRIRLSAALTLLLMVGLSSSVMAAAGFDSNTIVIGGSGSNNGTYNISAFGNTNTPKGLGIYNRNNNDQLNFGALSTTTEAKGNENVNSVQVLYRVYLASASSTVTDASPAFVALPLSTTDKGKTKNWTSNNSVNLVNSTSAGGSYIVEFFVQLNYSSQSSSSILFSDNNGNNNYKASFTVVNTQSATWNGSVSNDWHDGSNWTGTNGAEPTKDTDVTVAFVPGAPATYYPVVGYDIALARTLTIQGTSINTLGGRVFLRGGELQIFGNFQDPNAGFGQTGGVFTLAGSTQTFDGESFVEFHIQGGGTKTLSNKMDVSVALRFINENGGGILSTRTDNSVVYSVDLDELAVITGESSSSYVLGFLRTPSRTVTTALNSFGGIGVDLTANGGSPGLTLVTRLTGFAYTGPVGSEVGLKNTSVKRSFTFTPRNPNNLNFTLVFHYLDSELNGLTASNLKLERSITGAAPFENLGSNGSVANQVTVNSISGTLAATFTLAEETVNPLPVTLISFTATPTAQGAALLRWATATETNNRGFGIERQLGSNGTWQSVGFVAAGATTGSTYEYTDKSLITASASPQAYYRLRQEDLDAKVTYSPVAVINRNAAIAATELTLSPVPISSGDLSVGLAEAGQAGILVAVTNTQGQKVMNLVTNASADNSLGLPVTNLAAGVYIVTVQVPGQAVRHARFVKL